MACPPPTLGRLAGEARSGRRLRAGGLPRRSAARERGAPPEPHAGEAARADAATELSSLPPAPGRRGDHAPLASTPAYRSRDPASEPSVNRSRARPGRIAEVAEGAQVERGRARGREILLPVRGALRNITPPFGSRTRCAHALENLVNAQLADLFEALPDLAATAKAPR